MDAIRALVLPLKQLSLFGSFRLQTFNHVAKKELRRKFIVCYWSKSKFFFDFWRKSSWNMQIILIQNKLEYFRGIIEF